MDGIILKTVDLELLGPIAMHSMHSDVNSDLNSHTLRYLTNAFEAL